MNPRLGSLRNIDHPDAVLVDEVVAVAPNVAPPVQNQRLKVGPLAGLLSDHAAGEASTNN